MQGSPWSSYWSVWKNSFTYQGQATRGVFWSFIIINLFVVFFIAAGSYVLLVEVMADKTSSGGMALVWAYFVYLPLRTLGPLILFFPVLALGVRRMHDIGKSGWWFGGFLLFNVFGMPVFLIMVTRATDKWLSPETGSIVAISIYGTLTAISFIIPVWLCCKPTKIKEPTSSSDVVN